MFADGFVNYAEISFIVTSEVFPEANAAKLNFQKNIKEIRLFFICFPNAFNKGHHKSRKANGVHFARLQFSAKSRVLARTLLRSAYTHSENSELFLSADAVSQLRCVSGSSRTARLQTIASSLANSLTHSRNKHNYEYVITLKEAKENMCSW